MGRERGRGGGGARYRREPGSRDAYRTPRPGRPGRGGTVGPRRGLAAAAPGRARRGWPSRVAGVRPRQGSGVRARRTRPVSWRPRASGGPAEGRRREGTAARAALADWSSPGLAVGLGASLGSGKPSSRGGSSPAATSKLPAPSPGWSGTRSRPAPSPRPRALPTAAALRSGGVWTSALPRENTLGFCGCESGHSGLGPTAQRHECWKADGWAMNW